MKFEFRPRLRREITTPSYAWARLRVPSTTLTLTMTVSPGAKSGILLARRVISSCSNCWIRSIFYSKNHLAGADQIGNAHWHCHHTCPVEDGVLSTDAAETGLVRTHYNKLLKNFSSARLSKLS